MHLFGVNSPNLTCESFCFTMTVRHPSIFFTMTILSSLRVNFFMMLLLLILTCVHVLYRRTDGSFSIFRSHMRGLLMLSQQGGMRQLVR